jgi:hypothetical protein
MWLPLHRKGKSKAKPTQRHSVAEPQPKTKTHHGGAETRRRFGNQEREIIEGRFTGEQKVMERYEQITN